MSWSGQAAYRRGSFSTLLGAQHDPEHGTVEVLAVGDSLAVLADSSAAVSCWPFSEPEQFRERPTLFATLAEYNAFVSDGLFWTTRRTCFELGELGAPRLVCVTDALGEWLLRQTQAGGDGLARLLSMSTEKELEERSAETAREPVWPFKVPRHAADNPLVSFVSPRTVSITLRGRVRIPHPPASASQQSKIFGCRSRTAYRF